MSYRISFVALLCFFVSICGSSQISKDYKIDQSALTSLSHPYLLFTRESKLAMQSRIVNSPKLLQNYKKHLTLAEMYLKYPTDTKLPSMQHRSRYYAKSNEMTKFISTHIDQATTLAFMYQMTDNKAFADKAYEHAAILCELQTWVYQFHEFPEIYNRVWPWNVKDDQVLFSFDINSARVSNHMSLIYDWIYPMMTKTQRDKLRNGLLANAVTRVRGNYEYHWWANAYKCNWSGICHSGVGIAALALLKEDPNLMDVIERTYEGVSSMFDHIGPDGEWQEGRGYWAYGISHTFFFAEALNKLSNGRLNLFKHKSFHANALNFPLYSMTSNFGDGQSGSVGSSWFINKYVEESKSETGAWYKDNFVKSDESIFDLIWDSPSINGVEPQQKSMHFKAIDWVTMQSSFKSNKSFTVAVKAGLSDDPHHGHMDCGSFMLDYNGKAFIKDPGHSSYDDFYFNEERWKYTEAATIGHNVIMVNGENQMSAKLKDKPWKKGVGGNVTRFETKPNVDYLAMNLSKAYPQVELKKWERQIILAKPSIAVVMDKISTNKNASIISRLHPQGDVSEEKIGSVNVISISNSAGKVAVVPFADVAMMWSQGRDPIKYVREDSNLEWLPFVDLKANAANDQTRLGFIMVSFEKTTELQELITSLKYEAGKSLVFKWKGKAHCYEIRDDEIINYLMR